MKSKFVIIYGVECKNVQILARDKYGARIQYKVKHGRKLQKTWIDYEMIFNSPVLSDLLREFAKVHHE